VASDLAAHRRTLAERKAADERRIEEQKLAAEMRRYEQLKAAFALIPTDAPGFVSAEVLRVSEIERFKREDPRPWR